MALYVCAIEYPARTWRDEGKKMKPQTIKNRIARLQKALVEAESGTRPDPPWGAEGAALYAAIGEAIRAARCENELTQAQLAEMVGILRTSIVNIEAGRQRLPIDRLYDIADALGIQATALLPKNEAV